MLSEARQKIEKLKEAISLALKFPDNDEYCCSVLTDPTLSKYISERQMADQFGVSIPSVKRWRSGKNLPHAVVRPVVYCWILENFNLLG